MDTKNKIESQFMRGKELAQVLRVSRPLVSRWTKEGMPCIYIGVVQESRRGARPRYNLEQVMAWLESKRKEVQA